MSHRNLREEGGVTAGRRHRRWSNRELRRDLDRRRSRWNWRLLLGIVIATAPLAVYLQIQNLCVELNYEMDRLQASCRELEQQQRRLVARRAALEAPASSESWAGKNGLAHPALPEMVVVRRAASGRPDLVAYDPALDPTVTPWTPSGMASALREDRGSRHRR